MLSHYKSNWHLHTRIHHPFYHAGKQAVTEIGAAPGATPDAELVVMRVQFVWVVPLVVEVALWLSTAHLLFT